MLESLHWKLSKLWSYHSNHEKWAKRYKFKRKNEKPSKLGKDARNKIREQGPLNFKWSYIVTLLKVSTAKYAINFLVLQIPLASSPSSRLLATLLSKSQGSWQEEGKMFHSFEQKIAFPKFNCWIFTVTLILLMFQNVQEELSLSVDSALTGYSFCLSSQQVDPPTTAFMSTAKARVKECSRESSGRDVPPANKQRSPWPG